MKKLVSFIIAAFFVAFFFKHAVFAFEFPQPNNKFGIHLAQPQFEDIKKAAELVNSTGGNWGYVTLIIQDNDRSKDKWQEIFNLLREERLIPIIRIATHPEGASWKKPAKEDAKEWADFLDNLNWVVKNRYVVLFNEPNHAAEWGGTVDANDYAETAKEFAQKLKDKNPDFFIMLGAVDASAPNGMPYYLGEEYFLQNFFRTVPVTDFEKLFDGIASHSYPNPAFSGTPRDYGRGTIRTYEWELGLFRSYGVQKNLPVFITETGWSAERLSRATIASYFQTAFENVWLPDNRVVAVTPFVFDYQAEPFLNFSWELPSAQRTQEEVFYQQFYTVQALAKNAGSPEQIETGSFSMDLPMELVTSSNYHLKVRLKNTGQAIWDKKDGYELKMINFDRSLLEYFSSDIKQVKPFDDADADLFIKTANISRKTNATIVLMKKDKVIFEIKNWSFEIVPLPSIQFNASLFPKFLTNGERFEIQMFDEKGDLVFKRSGVRVVNGEGNVPDVQNVIPEKKYRIVVLYPKYLPRQLSMVIHRGGNAVRFKTMFPFDLNENGHLDAGDFITLVRNPKLFLLFFP